MQQMRWAQTAPFQRRFSLQNSKKWARLSGPWTFKGHLQVETSHDAGIRDPRLGMSGGLATARTGRADPRDAATGLIPTAPARSPERRRRSSRPGRSSTTRARRPAFGVRGAAEVHAQGCALHLFSELSSFQAPRSKAVDRSYLYCCAKTSLGYVHLCVCTSAAVTFEVSQSSLKGER